jgi:hypothetical protein
VQSADNGTLGNVVSLLLGRNVDVRVVLHELLLPFHEFGFRAGWVFGTVRAELIAEVKLPDLFNFRLSRLGVVLDLADLLLCEVGGLLRFPEGRAAINGKRFDQVWVGHVLGNRLAVAALILLLLAVFFLLMLKLELIDGLVFLH